MSINNEAYLVYNEERSTSAMRGLPRFGHSNKFSHLFGTDDQRTDYIYGLLFAGVLIIALFSAWSAVLLVFKCIGKRRIGYLSGSAMEVNESIPKDRRKPLLVRITFLISCIMVIVFAILVVTKGLTNIYNTVDTVYDSAVAIDELAEDANIAITSLQSIGYSAQEVRSNLIELVTPSFCPNRPELEEETGIPFADILNVTIDGLEELSDFVDSDFTELQESLDNAQHDAENVKDTTQNIDINDAQSLIIIVPYTSLCFFFLVGLALAWRGISVRWYQCLLSWFFLPLLIIMVVVSYLLSGIIAIMASGNADWCSGGDDRSPDGTIDEILNINGLDQSDLQYLIVTYYVSQCTKGDPFNFAKAVADNATNAAQQVVDFELGLNNATAIVNDLSDYCGQDFTPLYNTVQIMEEQLDLLVRSIGGILDVLSCNRIVPIYLNVVYGGTCKYSVNGVTWAFTGFLVVGIFGMLMIMFRTAYLPNTDSGDSQYVVYDKYNGYPPPEEGQEVEYNSGEMNESDIDESLYIDDAKEKSPDESFESPETSMVDSNHNLDANQGSGQTAATSAIASVNTDESEKWLAM